MPIVRVVLRSGALVREVTDGDAKFRCDVLIKFVRGDLVKAGGGYDLLFRNNSTGDSCSPASPYFFHCT